MIELQDEPPGELNEFPLTRFVDESCIGSGNNATVFRAWDEHLQRDVAFKISFLDDVDQAEESENSELVEGLEADLISGLLDMTKAEVAAKRRYSLLREARLLARVDHPNVISVLDVGVFTDGSVAVVMPYLEAGGLDEQEFEGPWEDILDTAMQIGRGLAAIHAAGILHRDFKPNNILFDRDRWPRIADLGLACMADDAEAMGDWAGTANYMAPEAIERRLRDVRDDLYAYCMVIYQMFYGHPPFATPTAREEGRVLRSIRDGGMPDTLHEILVRGLAIDPDERWPDMRTLLRAMKRVRQPARRRPAWPWAVAGMGLAASVALGMFMVGRPVQADACEEVLDELAPIWDREIRAELRGAFGTRKAGDGLMDWANRWVAVRAQECEAAKRDARDTGPTPCSASTRDRFQATLHAFRTPHLREGLHIAAVIAELPAPEHCLDDPEDAAWGGGGLLELRDLDIEVEALVKLGDLDVARARQGDYMRLAQDQRAEYSIARAVFWHGEIHRLEGDLDHAARDFETAYDDAQELGVPVFGAEALMKLTAVAGARGEIAAVDAYALAARGVFAGHQPGRVAELLQVQGLALLAGPEGARQRGVELLLHAVERREDQLEENGGTRELVSQAHESYARGLLAVHRASEALEYLDAALSVHQDEFGHGTWRTRGILRLKFLAQLQLRRFDVAKTTDWSILNLDRNKEDWGDYVDDAFWLANGYADAGESLRALWPLRAGRARALEQELTVEVARFDAAIEQILSQ